MIKKGIITMIATAFIVSSCVRDYDINQNFGGEFTPKVILNSMLTPDSLIKADVIWTRHVNDESDYKRVESFSAKLYEDENLIYDFECSDGNLITDMHPKAGSKYRIELDIPDYGIVKAETHVPTGSAYTSSYEGEKSGGEYSRYLHYIINNISTTQEVRALWVKSVAIYDDNSRKELYDFHMNNPFCDQVNAFGDTDDVPLKGSEISFSGFIRIPFKNISLADPLKFSVNSVDDKYDSVYIGEDDWGDPIWEDVIISFDNVGLLLITPSDDYDRYYKTLYRQDMFGDTGFPVFNETVTVYSNVENGIGIFAGYMVEMHLYSND